MNMFIKIGYRNLFRNRRRSFLTSAVIGLGLAAMIITDGFLGGMNEHMVSQITGSLVTEGQIHHPKFRDSFRAEYQILNTDHVEEILNHDPQVETFAKRVITSGMISSPSSMKNTTFYGIQPDNERKISDIYKYLVEGSYVSDESSLLIGSELQKRLEVVPGDKVVVTVAKADTGEISQEMMRVSGIITSGSKEIDEKTAFIHISKARNLLGIGNSTHEIGIKFRERAVGDHPSYALWNKLKKTGNSAESWKEIVSGFVSMMSMMDQSKAIIALSLMFLVALGIMNTLFMALYERMFEFAVLRAVGTKSHEIVLMIISEAGSLSFLSIFAGFLIAAFLAIPMHYLGLNFSGVEFADVTFHEPVRFAFSWNQVTFFPLITFIFTVLVGLYPAIHAARIKVAQALKRSL